MFIGESVRPGPSRRPDYSETPLRERCVEGFVINGARLKRERKEAVGAVVNQDAPTKDVSAYKRMKPLRLQQLRCDDWHCGQRKRRLTLRSEDCQSDVVLVDGNGIVTCGWCQNRSGSGRSEAKRSKNRRIHVRTTCSGVNKSANLLGWWDGLSSSHKSVSARLAYYSDSRQERAPWFDLPGKVRHEALGGLANDRRDHPGDALHHFDRLDLFHEERLEFELLVTYAQSVFVAGEKVDNPVAMDKHELSFVLFPLRKHLLVDGEFGFESHMVLPRKGVYTSISAGTAPWIQQAVQFGPSQAGGLFGLASPLGPGLDVACGPAEDDSRQQKRDRRQRQLSNGP